MPQVPVLVLGWPCDCWRNHRWHSFERYSTSKRKRLRRRAFEEVYETRKSEATGSRGPRGRKWGYHIISRYIYHTLQPYCQPTLTFDTRCPSNLSSLIPIAGLENPPNPSSPRSRRAHVSVATP